MRLRLLTLSTLAAAVWLATATAATAAAGRAADECRPAQVVVYTQSDWLRLAGALARNASPCAQYYVSVPPLAADKTALRSGQAAKIRALGPNFHALAELSWNGWSGWVKANGGSWAQAGAVARQRMAAAGFDVGSGDTWAVNELSSAVRRGAGTARQDVRSFLGALVTGGGTMPAAKGVVFVIGLDQGSTPLAPYKAVLEDWYQDGGFWTDMGADVSLWAQEAYGDVRAYAVAGASPQQRRDALVQYLGAPLALVDASGAPPAAATARSFLQAAYTPLANAAWDWASAYGFTDVPSAQMQDFVSAQVYASRALSAGMPADRLGFAWAPQNRNALAAGDFAAQTQAILDRLAAAIHDSAAPVDPNDPGIGACGPAGQSQWCQTAVAGAAFATQWQDFSTWSPTTLAFPSGLTALAGAPASVGLQVQTAGVPDTALAPLTATLSSSSPSGQFSTAATGPWTPTLGVTVPAGAQGTTVYYQDTAVGTPTLTAALPGLAPVTQTITVAAGAPTSLAVAPATATVAEGAKTTFTATAVDAYGNAISTAPTWTLSAPLGRLVAAGSSATFVAGAEPGTATVTAASGGLTATATVVVVTPPARVASARTRWAQGHLVVVVRVVAGARPAARVRVLLQVRKGSSRVATVRGLTTRLGLLTWRSRGELPRGGYVAKATLVQPAAGLTSRAAARRLRRG